MKFSNRGNKRQFIVFILSLHSLNWFLGPLAVLDSEDTLNTMKSRTNVLRLVEALRQKGTQEDDTVLFFFFFLFSSFSSFSPFSPFPSLGSVIECRLLKTMMMTTKARPIFFFFSFLKTNLQLFFFEQRCPLSPRDLKTFPRMLPLEKSC